MRLLVPSKIRASHNLSSFILFCLWNLMRFIRAHFRVSSETCIYISPFLSFFICGNGILVFSASFLGSVRAWSPLIPFHRDSSIAIRNNLFFAKKFFSSESEQSSCFDWRNLIVPRSSIRHRSRCFAWQVYWNVIFILRRDARLETSFIFVFTGSFLPAVVAITMFRSVSFSLSVVC